MKLNFKNWLKENTMVGGGAIRGAGQVTGEGSNSESDILQYINSNIQDADTRDNALKKWIKAAHAQFHGKPDTANFKTKK
jgi:hypothetical protein